MIALSIRQPWASWIVWGWKDIENREWPDWFVRTIAAKHLGQTLLIHASGNRNRSDFRAAIEFAQEFEQRLLEQHRDFDLYHRGGIVGAVTFDSILSKSKSPWFVGPIGLVFERSKPLDFVQCKGSLGFFDSGIEVKL